MPWLAGLARKTIAGRKSLNLARRERAERRGGGRVVNEATLAGSDGDGRRGASSLDEGLATLPTQEFDLHTEELLTTLDIVALIRRRVPDRIDGSLSERFVLARFAPQL